MISPASADSGNKKSLLANPHKIQQLITTKYYLMNSRFFRLTKIFITVLVISSGKLFAQLQVTASSNATQLAQTLAGSGVIVSNAKINCPTGASGLFNGTNSNLGITSGILPTNGMVANAMDPNTVPDTSADHQVTFSDPDLLAIEPEASYDLCKLEFDATPSCKILSFTFSFGSEEYLEFISQGFNDAYGIFVTGPNTMGPAYAGYNIALLPPPSPPGVAVTIDNVNNISNSQYYIENETPPGQTIQYDGFTKPINITLNVMPCATYRFKIAIADAGDGDFDSGVFLEKESLACSTLPISLNTTVTPTSCSLNNGSAIVYANGGTPPYSYLWNSLPPQTTQMASGLAPGTYSVLVKDSSGCFSNTTTVTIAPSAKLVADFEFHQNIAYEGSLVQFADKSTPLPVTSWVWNFDNGSSSAIQHPQVLFPTDKSLYTITLVVSQPPCTATITKQLKIDDTPITPVNIFTPNGDGLNDCFFSAFQEPSNTTLEHCIKMEIYDRWGLKIFESSEESTVNCWNGMIMDHVKAKDGTYYYIAKWGKTILKGYVELIR